MSSRSSSEGVTDGERLFAGAAHVEGGLALPLRRQHAVVVGTRHHHRPQPLVQRIGLDLGNPGPNSGTVVVEHSDHRIGEIAHLARIGVDGRAWSATRCRHDQVREVGHLSGASRRLRDAESKWVAFDH